MKDFIFGHTDALLISIVVFVALIISAGVVRGTVGRAVHTALIEIEFNKQSEVQQRERDASALANRLKTNPWNKDGAWNLTRQIEIMRQDFDGAQTLAWEAGVDITNLRGVELYVAPTAVVLNRPEPASRPESAVDDEAPRKARKPRKAKVAKKKN